MDNQQRLDPDTAPADRSIWTTVKRATLERHTQVLFTKKHVAGRQLYIEPIPAQSSLAYPLSFELEKSLADDFAFIAASKPQVDAVSAATVEQNEAQPFITLRLAANEGIQPDVKTTFDALFQTLRKYARKDITRAICQEQLFTSIVQLNCNRILGRLASARFKPPQHIHKVRDPLPERFRRLYLRHAQKPLTGRYLQDDAKLMHQIEGFETAFQQLERSSAELTHNIKRVIKEAYNLTENGIELPNRLRNLGFPESSLDARDVREVGKVSNYWRIARHLTMCCQQHRRLFAYAEWHPLVPYAASSTSQTINEQFVHAEIQLVAHYELTSPSKIPRAIGASKEACFLCDAFIKAHGRFSITGAHRQTFHQWTVPDLKEYDWQTVLHFRRVLKEVCARVADEYSRAHAKRSWRPFPLQSAINLNAPLLSTPSPSSLTAPSSRNGSDRSEGSRSVLSASTLRQEQRSLLSLGRIDETVSLGRTPSQPSSINRSDIPINHHEAIYAEEIVAIDTEEILAHAGWISLFASLSNEGSATSQSRRRKKVSVTVEHPSADDCVHFVNVADIPSTEELIIERGAKDTVDQLRLVLVGEEDRKVQIRCQWHD